MFFSGKVASMVAEVGSSFPRFRASIRESCRQKVHRTAARARFALQKIFLKKITFGALLKDEVGRLLRELDFTHKNDKKLRGPEQHRICPVEVQLSAARCANVARFCAALLLCRFATAVTSENTLRHETLCFSGKVVPWSQK